MTIFLAWVGGLTLAGVAVTALVLALVNNAKPGDVP